MPPASFGENGKTAPSEAGEVAYRGEEAAEKHGSVAGDHCGDSRISLRSEGGVESAGGRIKRRDSGASRAVHGGEFASDVDSRAVGGGGHCPDLSVESRRKGIQDSGAEVVREKVGTRHRVGSGSRTGRARVRE